ncbi:DUF6174 domain-containing protein [Rubrivirga sp.]|uniref:DUF6174 domain-containing protein n=1 Tax=Rubrivirga sp. TaxID=1885344 RepID=UPI003C714964
MLSACDTVGSDGPPSIATVDASLALEVDTADNLASFQAAWDTAGPEDYWLRYEVICFCAPQVVDVRVEGGQVLEAWQNGEPVLDHPISLVVLTVNSLYTIAANGFLEADAVTVRVLEADAPLPVSVFLDYAFEIADEEIGYRILGFETD